MSQKKKKNPRAYLNDFSPGEDGSYKYTGTTYTPTSDNKTEKRIYLEYAALSSAAFILCIIGGCIPSAGMLNCFYVILPFIAELAAAVSVLWAVCRMSYQGLRSYPLREYIYTSTVQKLEGRLKLGMILSSTAFLSTVLYIILNGFESNTESITVNIIFTIVYLIIKVNIFLLFFLLRKLSLKTVWNKSTVSLMNG